MIISLFLLKQKKSFYWNSDVLSCGDYYVDIHQPLICVAHDTKTLCFARKYNALSIYVCGRTVARV